MSTLRDLSVRLKELRELHGLTQEQFAEKAGISYKFYQQIEAGRKKQLWLETIERLASGYGLEAWQLLAPPELLGPRAAPPAKKPRVRSSVERVAAETGAPYGRKTVAPSRAARTTGRRKTRTHPR